MELLEARLETVSGEEGGRHVEMVWAQDVGFVGALSQSTSACCEFQCKVHIYSGPSIIRTPLAKVVEKPCRISEKSG